MNRRGIFRGIFTKRALIIVLTVLLITGGIYFLTPASRQNHTGHTKASPAQEAGTEATNGTNGVKTQQRKIKSYRSTMMPGEVSQTPRKDSMGMDMVPIYESKAPGGSMLELSEHARAMASVETVLVQRRNINNEIHVVGKVQYNETSLANITTRIDGYVERLFVNYTGIEVKKGDRLVDIYSPDLIVAQQEVLIALTGQHNLNLVEPSKRKLLRWGLTQEQIDELVRNKKVHERLTIFSPIKGTVIEKMIVENSAVKPGDVLYRLANLDSVWIYLDIYEYELPWVQYGQTAQIKSEVYPGQSFTGRVWFISPVLNEETRSVKVLLNIDNTEQKLKPGMFVSAAIRTRLTADGKPQGEQLSLAVPVTAVLDSGVRKLVYVETAKGQFSPVEIVTGPRAGSFYPVLSGLNVGDRVATRGNFLLDSQSQISGLPSLFYKDHEK